MFYLKLKNKKVVAVVVVDFVVAAAVVVVVVGKQQQLKTGKDKKSFQLSFIIDASMHPPEVKNKIHAKRLFRLHLLD